MKMKRLILIATATLCLAACGDRLNVSPSGPGTVPIRIGAAISGAPATRANAQNIQSTELAAGQTVGVFIYFKDAKTTDVTYSYGYKNLEYTVSGTSGDLALVTAANQPYFPELKTQNVDIYAFSPRTGVYTATTDELSTLTAQDVFTTENDQTTEAKYKASDFVWGKKANVTNGTATAVEVVMDHMLSKINVNVAPGTGMTLAKLDKAKVTFKGVVLDGTVDFTTGAVTPKSGSTGQTLTLSSAIDQSVTTNFTVGTTNYTAATTSAVIIPQTIASGATTTSTVDIIEIQLWDATAGGGAGGYTSTYTVKASAPTTFAAKTAYTYNIVVNTQGLSLTTTINDWTTGTSTNGTAE